MLLIDCTEPTCAATVLDAEGCPGYVQTKPSERGWVLTTDGWRCPDHVTDRIGGLFDLAQPDTLGDAAMRDLSSGLTVTAAMDAAL